MPPSKCGCNRLRAGDCHNEGRDTGVGIDEADLPTIGRRFFRSSSAADDPKTGIDGLVPMTIARLHGGSISVASQPDEGATLALRLLVVSAAPAPALATAC